MILHIAGATIFFTGENKWRKFDSWPTDQAKEEKIYLNEKNRLSIKYHLERIGL